MFYDKLVTNQIMNIDIENIEITIHEVNPQNDITI